jgi:hypothetical protein
VSPDPHLRAGDGDRERTAETLRRAFAEGRLTPDELDERLSAAYSARTMADLAQLTADLPEPDPYQLPVPNRPGPDRPAPIRSDRRPAHRHPPLRAALASYVTTSLLLIFIWVASGGLTQPSHQGFWPLWVIGPWGIALLGRTIAGRDDDRR